VFAQYYNHPNANKVGGVEQAAYIDADGLGKTNAVVGLEDLLTNDVLELYPNPADDKVTMRLADAPLKPVLWRISDQSGKEVLSGRIERGIKEVTIDTENLPSGMYIIQIFNDQNSWIPKKVIISH
ncbi:MAG: T9SS type A sorting domain-containing protein, partial [Cyclobacteriaceae bacterium]